MNANSHVTLTTADAESLVQTHCAQLLAVSSSVESRFLTVSYPLKQYWLNDADDIQLLALYYIEKNHQQITTYLAVSEYSEFLCSELSVVSPSLTLEEFSHFCSEHQLPYFTAGDGLKLQTLKIPKPWGQEIWYTGIEERGICGLQAQGFSSPLPWVLSALPNTLCGGRQRSLILLKILDPLAEEVFGDLYFELHEEKREVYVVTSVDKTAWPDGQGAIRFGFDQNRRADYDSDEAFKQAFVAAVKVYEVVRRKIDSHIDKLRHRDGIESNAAVDAEQLRDWLTEVPVELTAQEQVLRTSMEGFIHRLPLVVGDVIKVPCLTPHSLQHGVRTVEFQTPVYERLILSFAQKVLTQSHWDIDKAAQLMDLEPAKAEIFEQLPAAEGVYAERIVQFEDFDVLRVRLHKDSVFKLTNIESYGLLMAVQESLVLRDGAGSLLEPEQAVILSTMLNGVEVRVDSGNEACFLLAYPK